MSVQPVAGAAGAAKAARPAGCCTATKIGAGLSVCAALLVIVAITQKEYFEMFAIFNSTADEDRKDEAPVLELFSDEQSRKRKALEEGIADS